MSYGDSPSTTCKFSYYGQYLRLGWFRVGFSLRDIAYFELRTRASFNVGCLLILLMLANVGVKYTVGPWALYCTDGVGGGPSP